MRCVLQHLWRETCTHDTLHGSTKSTWSSLEKLLALLIQCIGTCSIAVSVFYWSMFAVCLLFCGQVLFDNIIEHGVTAILMMAEIFLSRTPVVSYHLQVCRQIHTSRMSAANLS